MGMGGLNTGNGNTDPEGWWMMVMDTWAIPPFLSFQIRFCLSAPLFFFIHIILILGGAVFFSLSFSLPLSSPSLSFSSSRRFNGILIGPAFSSRTGWKTGSYKVGTKQADERAFSGLD